MTTPLKMQTGFDDRDGSIWFDGRLVPWREANAHVLTHALHYASAVFEGQRAYGGEIFRLTDHSERLQRSAALMGFEIPWTAAEIDPALAMISSSALFSYSVPVRALFRLSTYAW